MTKSQMEADQYKNLSADKLKKVIKVYKSLSKSNSDIYNFLFTFIIMLVSTLLFFKLTVGILLLMTVIHYLVFWEFLYKYKKFKLVSDNDREEIDEIVQILESQLENIENKSE
jgi:membrane protein YdbS with pleckstrin-like domain